MSGIDGNVRKAGSAEASAEPAREQVVIRDKRKIDVSGRVKPTEPDRARAGKSKVGTNPASEVTEATGAGQADRAAPAAEPSAAAAAAEPSAAAAAAAELSAADSAAVDTAAADSTVTVDSTASTGQPAPTAAPATPTAATAGRKSVARPGTAPEGARPGGPGNGDMASDPGSAAGAASAQRVAEQPAAEQAGVADGGRPAPVALGAELEALRSDLDERLRDLQRVTAEYANYRKRVERDRGVMAEQAIATVLLALLPILDDLDRARDHGDLVGPFGAVAEQLTTALAKFGLAGFGEVGDAFDPTRHEAVTHQTSAEVTAPTCVEVMRRGYMLGDRLLRAALVAVADPE